MTDPNSPDFNEAEMQEQIAAEEMGVEPETIQLPPGIRRGITLFELETGDFGFIPITEGTTIMDAYVLAQRVAAGAMSDMIADKVVRKQTEQAVQLAKNAQAQRQQRPNIVIPGRKR